MATPLPQFSLRCYEPIVPGKAARRTDFIALDPRVTSLVYSHQLPGGCNALKVGLAVAESHNDVVMYRSASLKRPIALPDLGHVELLLGGTIVWAGRQTRFEWSGPNITGFEAQGYGVSGTADDLYLSQDSRQTTGGALLRRVLNLAAPLLTVPPNGLTNSRSFADPGVVHRWDEFNEQAPFQVVEQLAKEGGAFNQPFDWTVYPAGIGGQPSPGPLMFSFVPRIAPGLAGGVQPQVDYRPPWDDTVSMVSDSSQCYGTFRTRYTDIDSNQSKVYEYTEPTFAERFGGLYRRKLLQGSNLSTQGAVAFTQSYASVYAYPIWTGTIAREAERGIEQYPSGIPLPCAYVRAGQWVQIGTRTQPKSTLPPAPHEVPPLIIVRCEYDATSGRATIELNQPAPGIEEMLQGLRKSSQHQAALTNPTTGAPLFA